MFVRFVIISIIIFSCVASCSKDTQSKPPPPTPPQDNTVHVAGLTMNDTAGTLLATYHRQVSATIFPANANNKKIVWTSSNDAIVTVDAGGLVTAIAEGMAYITATSEDNPLVANRTTIYVLKSYDVYVVGLGTTLSWSGIGMIWKNGSVTQLTGGVSDVASSANAITVVNNDVYVAGTTMNENRWDVATYWKNGVPVQVSDPANGFPYYVNGLAVDGDNVYLAGFDFQTYGCPNCFYGSKAHYWKSNNGLITEIPLYDMSYDTVSTEAYGIALSGSNIFVAGLQAYDNNYNIVKYWQNNFNVGVEVTHDTWGIANDIALRGNEVILAGFDGCPNFGCTRTAKLWNTVASNVVFLTDGLLDAEAACLSVSGSTIYAAGYEKNLAGFYVAKCWIVNGIDVNAITVTGGETDAMIKDIFIKDDEIFLAGYEVDPQTHIRNARYWRVYHNMVLPVTDQTYSPAWGYSQANGIFVK